MQFTREMGCTVLEWRKWLDAALTDHVWQCEDTHAWVQISNDAQAGGTLYLEWQALPHRRIALLSIPRLHVSYRFEGVSDQARAQFMQRLDLFMQRGGG